MKAFAIETNGVGKQEIYTFDNIEAAEYKVETERHCEEGGIWEALAEQDAKAKYPRLFPKKVEFKGGAIEEIVNAKDGECFEIYVPQVSRIIRVERLDRMYEGVRSYESTYSDENGCYVDCDVQVELLRLIAGKGSKEDLTAEIEGADEPQTLLKLIER